MIAAEINTAYLAPLLAVSFTTTIAIIGWIVQTLWKINTSLSQMEERGDDHERRIDVLEERTRFRLDRG